MDESAYFRASTQTRRKARRRQEIVGVSVIVAAVLAFYCVLFPSGEWGRHIKGGLAWAFGFGRFFFPIWLGYVGYRITAAKPWAQAALRLSLWALIFLFGCTLATLFGKAAFQSNYGGAIGLFGDSFFSQLFGRMGAWIVSLGGLFLTLCGMLRVSPVEVFRLLIGRIQQDIREWKETRQTSVSHRPPVVKPRPLTVSVPTTPPAVHSPATSASVTKREAAPKPQVIEPVADKKAPEKTKKEAVDKEKSEGIAAKPAAAAVPATPPPPPYQLPSIDLLSDPKPVTFDQSEDALVAKARLLEQTLANFEVAARVTDINPGPVITRYDLEPAPGVKISSIVSLADDIALSMKATRVRVLAPVPGKGAVGIEIPNERSVVVTLKEILAQDMFRSAKSPLTFVLGKTSSGEPMVADLAPMPHLLVAGATGAGKSVCIHALIASILYKSPPNLVKFLLIDPKRLELPIYDGIPHIYDPRTGPEAAQVITQPKEAAKALARLVKVMEHRYEEFAKANVRNIEGFNEKRLAAGLPPEFYIVVIIDELADLMLVATREVEDAIQRLAQMARAVGIHLVLATQRPSVDVITGVIKANLPARIALRVASQTDSRVILDTNGAESLVGSGDMLFLPAGAPAPIRLQGAFVSEKDVESVVGFARKQGRPQYEDIFKVMAAAEAAQEDEETKTELREALALVQERRRVSQDLLKAHFGSSARATNVLSLLEVHGFIHKPEGTNRWEIYFDKIDDYLRASAGSNGQGE